MHEPLPAAKRQPIRFCASNIDLHSLEEFRKLQSLGAEPEESHCLGLCYHCSENKIAICGDRPIMARTPAEFWLALDACLSEDSPEFVEGRG